MSVDIAKALNVLARGDDVSYEVYEEAEKELDSLKREVLRKNMTLRGTFSSNGKMIFGSRVSIVSVR